jgi:putative flippase GtrA
MPNKLFKNPKLWEFFRFGLVGCTSVVVLYIVYYLTLRFLGYTFAYTLGYIVSFIVNYILTLTFTFKAKATKKNGVGFIFSHIVNYLMQFGCLNLFIWIGVSEQLAPIPTFAICVPTNFLLVRYFVKK